jgi:hypothetical protein
MNKFSDDCIFSEQPCLSNNNAYSQHPYQANQSQNNYKDRIPETSKLNTFSLYDLSEIEKTIRSLETQLNIEKMKSEMLSSEIEQSKYSFNFIKLTLPIIKF